MAHIDGRKFICDRCNKEIFCKLKGEKTSDGGFTRWDEFEPLPDGWGVKPLIGLLCCNCNKEHDRVIAEFMGGANDAMGDSMLRS